MFISKVNSMGLLRTIFIIILLYYAIKFLVKLFAPFLIKKAVSKMQQQSDAFQQKQQEPKVQEGQTIIDKAPVFKKNTKNLEGDYIDFEEINE